MKCTSTSPLFLCIYKGLCGMDLQRLAVASADCVTYFSAEWCIRFQSLQAKHQWCIFCVFKVHACTAAIRRKWLTRRNFWCLRRYESALSSKEALRSTSTDGKRCTAPCIGSCQNQIEVWTGPTPSLVRRVPKAFRKEKNCQSDHFSNKLFEITYTALKAGCIMKHTSPSSLSGKKTM